METLRSDGKAVRLTANAVVTKGDVVYLDGFFGVAMHDAVSGEEFEAEIAQREHEINVGQSITAAKGDVLYITSAGAISNSAGGNKPFMKVTVAKDANNYVWGILLPQA